MAFRNPVFFCDLLDLLENRPARPFPLAIGVYLRNGSRKGRNACASLPFCLWSAPLLRTASRSFFASRSCIFPGCAVKIRNAIISSSYRISPSGGGYGLCNAYNGVGFVVPRLKVFPAFASPILSGSQYFRYFCTGFRYVFGMHSLLHADRAPVSHADGD